MGFIDMMKSSTGNVTKAILVVRNPKAVWKNEYNKDGSRKKRDFKVDEVAQNEAKKLYENMKAARDGGTRVSLGSLSSAASNLADAAALLSPPPDYIMIEVQYNPTSLKFQSAGGKYLSYNDNGGMGSSSAGLSSANDVPAHKDMVVTLILDSAYPSECFIGDFNTSLTQIGKSVVNAIAAPRGGHSVKEKVEFLLAMNLQNELQDVYFVYGQTMFHGDITSVRAQYTMFNQNGNPVRAQVTIKLSQRYEDKRYDVDKRIWAAKYAAFIAERGGADDSALDDAASALL